MVEIINIACPQNRLAIKCPHPMTPTRIIIHNTANDATARNEVAYMHSNTKQASFHFAVDDVEIIQGIALNRNAWNAGDGNGVGNREGIAIEICYSKSGGPKFEKAMENAAELTAHLLKQYGWGMSKVTKHQDYSGKYCPHRILSDYGWDYYLKLVQKHLDGSTPQPTPKPEPKPEPTPAPSSKDVIVTYRVRTKAHGWLPEVKNLNDYAGWEDSPITDVAVKVDVGTIKYRVHVLRGGWLPWVSGYNINDVKEGYAGNSQPIDAIEIYYYTPDDIRPFKKAKYRVAPISGRYYSWQHDSETKNGQDGYAGIFGTTITKLQIDIV